MQVDEEFLCDVKVGSRFVAMNHEGWVVASWWTIDAFCLLRGGADYIHRTRTKFKNLGKGEGQHALLSKAILYRR